MQNSACVIFLFALLWIGCSPSQTDHSSWEVYNGSKAGIKYSSLTQIDTQNVSQLTFAWTYHSGDADTINHSQIQCNPIIIDGILYGVNPRMKLFALDAASGKQLWTFDPNSPSEFDANRFAYHILINSRGIAYWTDGHEDKRIFFTAGSFTFAVNAKTGEQIRTFGEHGSIDLRENLDRDARDLFVVSTSPGIVYRNLLIMGTRVDESPPSAPGHIRAYDVVSGKLVWIFHTIPHPGEYGYDTWNNTEAWKSVGGANVWSGFSLDEKRGILFAPTGSASSDFYGGKRKGSNLFANCLLAIDAATGKRIWHFQFIHHDLWDMDLPTPPALVTLVRNGKEIDAVVQTTKTGMVYVFERESGKPLFDIDEVPVDTVSKLPGEHIWPTQPIPRKPPPFARQSLSENDINPYLTDSVTESLRRDIKSYRYGNMFIPPGKEPSLVFPGYDGGGEWGGPAVDPQSGILYVNANEMAWIMKMEDNVIEHPGKETVLKAGQRLYGRHCASCHGKDLQGTGNNPTLINMQSKFELQSFIELVDNGRRMMPAYRHLREEEKKAIASFILDIRDAHSEEFISTSTRNDSMHYVPYKLSGYVKFLSPDGYPAITPPWGTLNAIDLNAGEIVWKIALGEYEELKSRSVPATGTENYGGPVVTAGGLVFIAATRDRMFRAFHKRTGKLLWQYTLPASGFATPAIYELDGKQFVVIACGGGKLNTTAGDAYVAFSLPDE